MKNESTDLVALIKSLNEYYDSKYELLKIGNAVDNETGEVIINDGLNGKGDVNGDGEVNFLDGILVLRYTQGITQLTSEQLTKADVNLDGRVDEKDANMILEYDAEIISGFNKANLNIQKDIGDVNGDGEVNFLDAAMILRYIRGIDTFTDEQKEKADFNLDGKIDENDARMILEYDAGISDGYKKSILNINLTIAPQSEQKVYIELKVKPENIYEIIDKGVDVKLDNIVEIASYGSKDKDGNTYAGIDKDSQPGNTDVTDNTTWEDDTDRAPGLLLKLQEERKTNGTVFEDSTDNTIKPGEARQGNGQYDAGEKGISGITVRLVDESGKTVNKYVKSDKGWETEEAKTTTDQNGNYEISGFLPGKYHLEYTWGGQTNKDENGNDYIYRVQNYKSTIWTKESRTEKDKENSGLEWYKINAQSDSPRYSDALDNYETRKTIDEKGKDVTNKVQHELKDTSNLLTMTSTTPDFMVNLEYNTGETESGTNDEYELVDGNIKVDENGYVVKKDGYKNELKNIDFGIVRRPKQQISLDKYVKEAKITLANGNVLIDAKMKDDGTLENEVKYVSYIPKVDGLEGSKGQLKIEIDSELIHGATLEVTYGFKVKNISEIDYATSDYYYYGTVEEADKDKIITLTPKQIIDYVDNDLVIADDEKWSTVENKTKLQDDGLLEKGNDMTKHLNSVNKILLYETPEDVKLKPIGADSETTFDVELKATRLLANSTDETYMENNAEIIEVVKTGGSILVTTPGNYIPADSATYESDSSSSESLVVLPPTGLTTNVIAWTMIALASLVIFIPGIILIKKYVLKK